MSEPATNLSELAAQVRDLRVVVEQAVENHQALLRENASLTARAVRAERVIRDAAHLMSTRMEGTSIVDSYGAAYRVLFGHLYPDQPLPNPGILENW